MLVDALTLVDPGLEVEIVRVKTLGDRKQGTAEASKSDKKDWILDLELALLNNTIDIAIHSGKDIPIDIEAGTQVCSVLKRASALDAFIGREDSLTAKRLKFSELPYGATIGTASLRRKASLNKLRPDLRIIDHRGNVPTRIEKMNNSAEISGIILASAGLSRLGYADSMSEELSEKIILPAVNQGTLGIQFRQDDHLNLDKFGPLIDKETQVVFEAERSCAYAINGDCHSALGIYAQLEGQSLSLAAEALSHDGKNSISLRMQGSSENPKELGQKLGCALLERGADKILAESSC
ncbi:UNVERIFIED_CONTAM: hypothetical protein GTU68_024851 [Idotea baltica]|nr:hypothetical protein [Idotea baltica]